MIERIGRYSIDRMIGEGGMGVVYAAHDTRLERRVAIKTIRADRVDERSRARMWREARAAAKINHPNVCQLYEIDEENGVLYLAMELLEGESLEQRIERGPLSLDESLEVTLAVLAALEALHQQGVVHRDLKPSNVVMTPAGVKLLDFGLARPMEVSGTDLDPAVTQVGMLVGTPRYMAPELWREQEAGPPADIFAAGALAYEMVTGKPAFGGTTLLEVFESVLNEDPPLLGGSPAVARFDQVIHRALRKKAADRYPSADAMAAALRELPRLEETGERIAPQPMVRLMGLPLRVLRPDPETDFLAFSLPDAVTCSLSGLGSLAVRSSAAAARFAVEPIDLARIATEAEVDVVLSGSLMRAGDQVRVTAQLLEAPAGTVLWSQVYQTPIQDLFVLQDALTQRIVESLAVPLSSRERAALHHDAPASAQAYELYLRANQVAYDATQWQLARDLYRKCLDLDPQYAPAWARLGRVYRALSIYGGRDHEEMLALAQDAFRRALELNPDLSIAHNLYTNLEVELGGAEDAMVRLIGRARSRMHDPELFAGLVQASRYCGLLEVSIAAYERTHRIDPGIRTSVSHAYLMIGDYEQAIATTVEDPPLSRLLALDLAGRTDEAIAYIRNVEDKLPGLLRDFMHATRTALEKDTSEGPAAAQMLASKWTSRDPCGGFYVGRHLARFGAVDLALSVLRKSVEGGFLCPGFMRTDPWLDSVRDTPEFQRLVTLADERRAHAQRAFVDAGGEAILGIGS